MSELAVTRQGYDKIQEISWLKNKALWQKVKTEFPCFILKNNDVPDFSQLMFKTFVPYIYGFKTFLHKLVDFSWINY